jgi:hypothetical protein
MQQKNSPFFRTSSKSRATGTYNGETTSSNRLSSAADLILQKHHRGKKDDFRCSSSIKLECAETRRNQTNQTEKNRGAKTATKLPNSSLDDQAKEQLLKTCGVVGHGLPSKEMADQLLGERFIGDFFILTF